MYNSIYPIQIKPYVPPQTKKAVQNNEDDNESSNPSRDLQKDRSSRTDANTATDPNGKRSAYSHQEFPNGQKTTIDYSKSKVNIAQILTDFKNTAIAIGSPPNIIQEVDQYLALAETQSLKNEPNKKIIQSNLKNASNVLDDFISKTLNKKSKVVENWIDALFLQQVDYKSDPETINADFLVKLPDKETGEMKPISKSISERAEARLEADKAQAAKSADLESQAMVQEASIAQKAVKSGIYIPQNEQIRKAFLQGKKYSAINEPEKAIEAFQSAIEQAHMLGDNKAEGMACFELGQIYDRNDNLEDALKYYNQAHKSTDDNNLKAKAYYSMAQIYDDVVYFEPAMNHYFAAISFAGEAENLNAQTKALADIGDMYAQMYDAQKTHEYYDTAKSIALETKNNKTMGAIWSRAGDSMTVINENVNALQDYKASAKFYEEADSPAKMARNYEKASNVMLRLGNSEKARNLLEKAQKLALKADDSDFTQRISKKLNAF